ncbi:scoloptoxin SSD14-like [Haemaphysalis longicornis]
MRFKISFCSIVQVTRFFMISSVLLIDVDVAHSTNSQNERCSEKLHIECEPESRSASAEVKPPLPPSRLGIYSRWAVSTDAAPCAQVARKIYAKGGKTVDAAIATLLCMGVVLPHSMGIGGGFIATVYSKNTSKAEVLVAREVAPKSATRDMFQKRPFSSIFGGLAIAVPGELRGYEELHNHLNGTLCWRDLFEYAVRLAKCGFPMGAHLANALQEGVDKLKKMKRTLPPTFNRIFNRSGTLLKVGEKLLQEDLGKTLEDVANSGGADYFYKGDFAVELAEEIKNNSGIITTEDLKEYKVDWMPALEVCFQGQLTMLSAPPPGSGPVLAHILGIMDQFRNSSHECLEDIVLTWHRFVEACKFSYAKRALLGDPKFVDISQAIEILTSVDSAAQARAKIKDDKTFGDLSYYDFVKETQDINHGTSHASFWGEDGVVISVSSSINYYFGSVVRTNSGVILNNQMDDFSTPGRSNLYGVAPSEANYIEPQKRPMSSMAPTVFLGDRKEPVLALGGTGGSKITSGVALVTLRTMWMDQDIKHAIDASRLHHQLIPAELMVEPSFPPEQAEELKKKGHNVTTVWSRFSVIMGVRREGGRLYANADYRKGGDVDGD